MSLRYFLAFILVPVFTCCFEERESCLLPAWLAPVWHNTPGLTVSELCWYVPAVLYFTAVREHGETEFVWRILAALLNTCSRSREMVATLQKGIQTFQYPCQIQWCSPKWSPPFVLLENPLRKRKRNKLHLNCTQANKSYHFKSSLVQYLIKHLVTVFERRISLSWQCCTNEVKQDITISFI